MSKQVFSDRRHKYRKLSKQELLDIVDEVVYRRFDDGRLTGIDLFKKKALIHQSVAYYQTIEGIIQLVRVTGKFQSEIFQSWLSTNIRTAEKNNILIDKLTQTAYTARELTLSNNGASAFYSGDLATRQHGKYFPRGCRGFISKVYVYAKDSNGKAIPINLSVNIGTGLVKTVTVTPGSDDADWYSADVNIMWNFDSMFIWSDRTASGATIGYDNLNPETEDAFFSDDDNVTWAKDTGGARRIWFKIDLVAMTIGDLPVTGTMNTIPIPNDASSSDGAATPLTGGDITTIFTVNGSGTISLILLRLWVTLGQGGNIGTLNIIFHVDGTDYPVSLGNLLLYVNSAINTPTPITFSRITTTAGSEDYRLSLKLPVGFKRIFILKIEDTASSAEANARALYFAEKLT